MPSFPGKRVALIVGGVTPDDIIPTSEVELIDLDDPTTTCRPTAPYPVSGGIAAGVGLLVDSLMPSVCGGIVSKTSVSDCYGYSFANVWTNLNNLLGTMTVPRQEFAGIVMDDYLVALSGGAKTTQSGGVENFWKSSELAQAYDGGGFNRGPDLPTENFGHCMVALDSSRVFIAGGFFTPNTAYVYDMETATLSEPLAIPGPHSSHACGSFKNATTGQIEVVIVGGDDGISRSNSSLGLEEEDILGRGAKDETHIFSPSSMTFREGPRFPFAVSYASAIQDGGDSFIVTGGTDGAIISDLLVRFDAATETFQVMTQRMAIPRSQHMAVYVDIGGLGDICV